MTDRGRGDLPVGSTARGPIPYKTSGWRAARVAACWERGGDGPWLLVSDRPDGARLFRRYAQRTWTEELFRDEKSTGGHLIQAGLRRRLETTRQRRLSLLQIGLRFLMFCVTQDRPLPENLSPVPPVRVHVSF